MGVSISDNDRTGRKKLISSHVISVEWTETRDKYNEWDFNDEWDVNVSIGEELPPQCVIAAEWWVIVADCVFLPTFFYPQMELKSVNNYCRKNVRGVVQGWIEYRESRSCENVSCESFRVKE